MNRTFQWMAAALIVSAPLACNVENEDDAPPFVPTLVFSVSELTFGNTLFNRSRLATFTIQNLAVNGGTIDMAVGLNSPFSIVSPSFPLTIGPLETITVTLRFSPSSIGLFEDSLVITTDDPQRPQVGLIVRGTGIDVQKTEFLMPGGNIIASGSRVSVLGAGTVLVTSPGANGVFGDGDDVLIQVDDQGGATVFSSPGQSVSHRVSIGARFYTTQVAGATVTQFAPGATSLALAAAPSTGIGSSPVDLGSGNAVVLDTAGTMNVARFSTLAVDSQVIGTFGLTAAASFPIALSGTRVAIVDQGGDAAFGGVDDDVVAVDTLPVGGPFPVHRPKAVNPALLHTLSGTLSRPFSSDALTYGFTATAHPTTGVAGNFIVQIAITAFGAAQTVTVLDLVAAGVGAPLSAPESSLAGGFVFLAEGPVTDGFADRLVRISLGVAPSITQSIVLSPPPFTPPVPALVQVDSSRIDFGDPAGGRVGLVNLSAGSFSTLGAVNIADPSSTPARDDVDNIVITAPTPTTGLHVFENGGAGALTTSSLPGVTASVASRTLAWERAARKFVVGVPAPGGSTGRGAIFRIVVPP